jgi:hypothetical protein
MNRIFTLVASSVLGLSILGVTRDAHALGPVDVEVGAKVGYATNPSSVSGVTNPLGFGLGGRAGLAFLGGIYLGGNIMYYLGGSTSVPGGSTADGATSTGVSVSTNTLMYGGEVGYGIKLLDLLTIRPQVGIGNATFTSSVSGGPSQSTSNWYLEPGVTGLIGLGLLFVGADVNALFFPGLSNTNAAFSLHGQVGLKF